MSAPSPAGGVPSDLRERTLLLHLVVLWGFAVVQPTLSVLSDSVPFFFPLRRVDGWLFVAVLVAVAVAPPLLMWGAGALAGRRRPMLRWRLHLVAVGLVAAGFMLYLLRELVALGVFATVPVTVALSAGFSLAYGRVGGLRSTLTVLAPAPVVFLVAFLGFSDASKLVLGGGDDLPAAQKATRPAPVVMLLLDELPIATLMKPGEELDAERFPNFARLAADSTWYRNALTPSWTTFTAVPAILTGRRPDPDALPVVGDHPSNIFTLLRGAYRETVIESFTRLCPLVVCPNSASALSRVVSLVSALSIVYVRVVMPRKSEIRGPNPGNTWRAVLAARDPKSRIDPGSFETADLRLFPGPQFERLLVSIGATGGPPPLYFLHSNLPHNPYTHLPSGKLYRDHDKAEPGLNPISEHWRADRGAALHGLQRHIVQTQFADKLLGNLLDRLEQTGIYDDALVIVVADHGASFIPGHNRRKPGAFNASDIAFVPLFVKLPAQRRAEVVDEPVSVLDVVPTIAETVGIELPYEPDGRPLSQAGNGAPRSFTILDDDDRAQPLDLGELRDVRASLLRRKADELGTGNAGPGVFGIGPGRALVGRDVASLARGKPRDAGLEIVDADEYDDVDLDGPFVPALVRGTLTASTDAVPAVVVAVNGRIAGAGTTSPAGDGAEFSLLVPEDAFRAGRNDVKLYAVRGSGNSLQLEELS